MDQQQAALLLAKGDLAEFFRCFIRIENIKDVGVLSINEIIVQSGRFNIVERNYRSGLILFPEYLLNCTKILDALVSYISRST